MPSHNTPSALIKLYFADNGLPWSSNKWQTITGIHHGLFPSDDSLLPKGITRHDADDIWSYFQEYNALDTEAKKIQFAVASRGSSAIPGRKKWSTWVNKLWERCKIHAKIVACFRQQGVHPIDVLINEGNLEGEWPSSDLYLPIAMDSIALELLGDEAYGEGSLIRNSVRKHLTIIAQRSWDRIRRHIKKDLRRLEQLERDASEAFEGVSSFLFSLCLCRPLYKYSHSPQHW